ncbi:formylglycine-generating enzyme required for sulfatase activity/HEPN domain-containing protein [Streptomyces umbrinus]|uniref:Formylglycine-generating enzyme required for sulfatase activity/HEPN domain-containing protein n=1 Tax=Streptomyces umbrinus TaxID=67370 RepID=A0ABU0T1P3_9ACTN|nr:SUMF1/EgtB/PvdO family nonheme iron enzyme [Streptomyces umbrinus]MDQ1029734.1 formylglycine-generating enzyme required for sulfatase activity/HEPN domain-containing protein [Streptomyces umbrinus]
MSTVVDERLRRLRSELDDHSRIADRLGLDLERPLRSLNDGYPENAVALIGKLTEKLLKELWRHHGIEGDPSTKALNDLVKRCRPHIRSSTVIDALEDIRRLRNRSTHDGYDISDEDGLLAVRRLVDVLVWFTDTGSAALLGGEPDMAPEVARRCEFLAGLYVTLGYRQAKRFVLSPDTVYQLFCRESGMRLEYVELMLSRDADDLSTVLAASGGELLRTRLPKLTRFVVVDDDGGAAPGALHRMLGLDFRIVRYDGFVDTIVSLETHLADLASADYPAEPRTAVAAAALTTDPHTGESKVERSGDAAELLARLARGSANVLVTGRPGSGKSTLLRSLAVNPETRRFRFYFDLGLKPKDEPFSEYAGRILAPSMASERSRAYDLFLYLIRSGTALCVLDAVDEGVEEASPAGFLRLFADLAAVLSAESAVVMSSRVSFLADSPQVRQLLDSGAGRSEQLVEQMYANGVDPSRVPHFHVVRLVEPDSTPLEKRLSAVLELPPGRTLAEILGAHITRTLTERGRPELEQQLPAAFGPAFLTDRTVFSLLDLHRQLGADAFTDGRLELDACVLAPLLRPAGPDHVAFMHTAYQELLAARHLAGPASLDAAADIPDGAFLTEQVRAFLAGMPGSPGTDDCVLPAGAYLVGPAERLLIRNVQRPVRFDRHAVTVAHYRGFLDALESDGTSQWDHPDQPAHVTHHPWTDRLRRPDYYENSRYDDHPAICVNWWSAYAYAAFEGKRLPTSLEWEAAARGTDGRLFPWGDMPDSARVNCADSWVGRPVVTYQAWYRDFADDAVRRAGVTPVGEHPGNRSPFGVLDMVGNCWEWTSTSLTDPGEAVICGGSYDNPMRAVQASTKGIYRKRGGSNAVGFRCVQDIVADTTGEEEPTV